MVVMAGFLVVVGMVLTVVMVVRRAGSDMAVVADPGSRGVQAVPGVLGVCSSVTAAMAGPVVARRWRAGRVVMVVLVVARGCCRSGARAGPAVPAVMAVRVSGVMTVLVRVSPARMAVGAGRAGLVGMVVMAVG